MGGGVLIAGLLFFFSVVVAVLVAVEVVAVMQGREGAGLGTVDELWGSLVSFSRFRRGHSEMQDG